MTANERWTYPLTCPKCGLKGEAEVTELDGWPFMRAKERGKQTRWINVSKGFHVGERADPTIDDISCADCHVRPFSGR